jgi:Cytochrome c biogenesis factor
MQERFDEAEVILIETLRKRSDFSVGWFTLGVIYEKKSDAASAVAAYDKAIRWRPDFQSARGRKFLLERKVKEQSGKAEPMVF